MAADAPPTLSAQFQTKGRRAVNPRNQKFIPIRQADALAAVKEVLEPLLSEFPVEAFDPMTAEQEEVLQAWFKKIHGVLV